MADLAERQESRHNISLFNLARFIGKISDLYKDLPGMSVSGRPVRQLRPMAQTSRRYAHRTQRARRDRNPDSFRLNREFPKRTRRSLPAVTSDVSNSLLHDIYAVDDSTDPRYWEIDDVKPFWL
jgi:hypothetical protein